MTTASEMGSEENKKEEVYGNYYAGIFVFNHKVVETKERLNYRDNESVTSYTNIPHDGFWGVIINIMMTLSNVHAHVVNVLFLL